MCCVLVVTWWSLTTHCYLISICPQHTDVMVTHMAIYRKCAKVDHIHGLVFPVPLRVMTFIDLEWYS